MPKRTWRQTAALRERATYMTKQKIFAQRMNIIWNIIFQDNTRLKKSLQKCTVPGNKYLFALAGAAERKSRFAFVYEKRVGEVECDPEVVHQLSWRRISTS